MTATGSHGPSDRLLLRVTGALSLVAAALHAGAVDEHLREWWGYGAFFVVASLLQGGYGLLLLAMPVRTAWEPSRWRAFRLRVYGLGLAGTLAVIALYIVTRTVGIPLFGPEAGTVEPVAGFDLVTKGAEALMAVGLAALYRRTSREGHSLPATAWTA